ncbi:hypothetical protein V6N13_027200 [Hibiscus sabdariffa]|uniref:Uncharacterized protein n=1 Tax=Hibiscus sabdariffa TaxID=183260 RepID=A0ABR2NKE8_9ROSI
MALSFFLCISFFPLLNSLPDITKTCDKVKHKELCIGSFKESYLGRYIPDNAEPKTIVLKDHVPLTPDVGAKSRICDQEVVRSMKKLDKVRTAMEMSNCISEKLNMQAEVTSTDNCVKELTQVEAQS